MRKVRAFYDKNYLSGRLKIVVYCNRIVLFKENPREKRNDCIEQELLILENPSVF